MPFFWTVSSIIVYFNRLSTFKVQWRIYRQNSSRGWCHQKVLHSIVTGAIPLRWPCDYSDVTVGGQQPCWYAGTCQLPLESGFLGILLQLDIISYLRCPPPGLGIATVAGTRDLLTAAPNSSKDNGGGEHGLFRLNVSNLPLYLFDGLPNLAGKTSHTEGSARCLWLPNLSSLLPWQLYPSVQDTWSNVTTKYIIACL